MTEAPGNGDRSRLLTFVAVIGGAVLIVAVVLSTIAIVLFVRLGHTVGHVKQNTRRVENLTNEVARIEQQDTVRARDASYRQCEREQRDRAEQHFRAALIPPAQAKALARQFGVGSRLADKLTLTAIRRRLPIFDCTPNLRGEKARVMTDREQRIYVRRYISGELAPVPAVPPDQAVLSNRATASPSVPAPDTPAPTAPTRRVPPAADHGPRERPRSPRATPTPRPAPALSPSPPPSNPPAPAPQPLLPRLPCVPLIQRC